MTVKLAIATMIGAFLLPFSIKMLWGRMVEKWGAVGGWLAAVGIVGTIWAVNHGKSSPMIYQTGTIWIDMALAAAVGLFTASIVSGGKVKKSLNTVLAAVTAGVIGGFILSLL
jgi:hypothetical protein